MANRIKQSIQQSCVSEQICQAKRWAAVTDWLEALVLDMDQIFVLQPHVEHVCFFASFHRSRLELYIFLCLLWHASFVLPLYGYWTVELNPKNSADSPSTHKHSFSRAPN